MNPIQFSKPYFSPDARREIAAGIERILASGQMMLGEYTTRFETEFAGYVGTRSAVSTNTCTTALQIALTHFDVRGREVLLPAAGFITNISVVRWAGGIPVLVDIDPNTLSFDLEDLRRKVTPATKGLIWIHLTGVISPAWREIVAFARERGLFLIEDCAHAHGASVDGLMAGSLADAGCFSFYPTKVMTTGTGGLLTTNDEALANTAREMRLFGRAGGTGAVVREGNDWFMDEIRACVGCYQLQDLEEGLARRRAIADRYCERLTGVPGIRLLELPSGHQPAWYHFTVFVDPAIDYPELVRTLKEAHGIPTKPIYLPLHQEPIFRDFDNGSLTQTETALNRSLCLPLHVEMEDLQVDFVADMLTAALKSVACQTRS